MHNIDKGIVDDIAARIAGEIVLAESPGKAMRKWREYFSLSQIELAVRLNTTPSVISDYESGRRKSPGARFVKKFVDAILGIELERGGYKIQLLVQQLSLGEKYWMAVIDMKDFYAPIPFDSFLRTIRGTIIVPPAAEYMDVHGYTVVDSIKLILDVPSHEYFKLYGTTTQRAAIFINVKYGRSPLIALKSMMAFANFRPSVMILHNVERPDYLGIEIARRERIPLAVTSMPMDEMLEQLRSLATNKTVNSTSR